MIHVGIYIAALRNGKLTQEELANKVGVSEKIVRAWEKGVHEPKIGFMNKLLDELQGSWDDIKRLMLDDADEAMARDIARRRRAWTGLTDEQRAFLESLTPDQRDALLAFAQRMRQS